MLTVKRLEKDYKKYLKSSSSLELLDENLSK